jgi:MYXO-CTERM domain-containing protein
MPFRPAVGLLAVALAVATPAVIPVAQASPVTAQSVAPLGADTEIGARIRWGGNGGFRGSVFDPDFGANNQINQQSLNGPLWQVGTAYGFEVRFTSASGALSLAVDFNRNQQFSSGETVTRSVFGAPGPSSFAGESFEALWISVRQNGTARSSITDLVVNGAAQASLAPAAGQGGGMYFLGANGQAPQDWVVRGNVTFFGATAQESPAWDFKFMNVPTASGSEPTAVSAPAGVAVLALGLLGLAAVRRRRA